MGKVYEALQRAETERGRRGAPVPGLAAPSATSQSGASRARGGRFARLRNWLGELRAPVEVDDANSFNKRRIALLQPDSFVAEQFRSLCIPAHTAIGALLWDARYSLLTVALAGFGRAVAEVGAVIIVGGNINHLTRVMTTAIALETSKGDLALALALGLVLMSIALAVNAGVMTLRMTAARYAYA